ncbi:ATP-binding protein [Pseudoduganella ginsengisoli]|uniref:histidine kinase n=1 Tax=Pseudoduganella ginsengisoli TaxID=1462440 RepID=A0A6L6Q5Q8_9BURK|nr:ATP-binding protein [Pseudoduganella ginsengisoli]MTW04836.1 two-component sensor histidine kinase [Pseudoduganella ginsengisoli]
MNTIRRRLLAGLLLVTLVCVASAGTLLYRSLRKEVNELADLQLRQLVTALPDEFTPGMALPAPEDPEEEFVLQAWDQRGVLQFTSRPHPVIGRYLLNGFDVVEVQGQRWRVYGENRHHFYIQVAQQLAVREAVTAEITLRSGAPLLALAIALVLLLLYVVRRATVPLDRLARAVADRSPATLDPLNPNGWPSDLSPVVQALNGLLAAFGDTLASQRVFIADAAHELRSPLTALKLQVQLVQRATTDEERSHALGLLQARLDRASHLVQQLLSLARFEAGHSAAEMTRLDLAELLRCAVPDHAALADSRNIDLGVEAPQAVWVDGDPDSLRVLLNNLVDNALRYTQPGGTVDLEAAYEHGAAVLRVRDNGPGVAPEASARLFDRFFRAGSGDDGCGLGLSIVSNIARHHQAGVSVDHNPRSDGTRGLVVTVRFPVPPARGTP